MTNDGSSSTISDRMRYWEGRLHDDSLSDDARWVALDWAIGWRALYVQQLRYEVARETRKIQRKLARQSRLYGVVDWKLIVDGGEDRGSGWGFTEHSTEDKENTPQRTTRRAVENVRGTAGHWEEIHDETWGNCIGLRWVSVENGQETSGKVMGDDGESVEKKEGESGEMRINDPAFWKWLVSSREGMARTEED